MVNTLVRDNCDRGVLQEIKVLRPSSSLTLNSSAVLTRMLQFTRDNSAISADMLCKKSHEFLNGALLCRSQWRAITSRPDIILWGGCCVSLSTPISEKSSASWVFFSWFFCVSYRTPWRWCSSVCGRTAGRYWVRLLGSRSTFELSTLGKAYSRASSI